MGTVRAHRDRASRGRRPGGCVRRVHLGARQPGNWVQLLKFGLVGGSGYVVNLAVFALLSGPLGVHHIAAAVGAFCVAVDQQLRLEPPLDLRRRATATPASRRRAFFAVSLVGLGFNLALLELFVSGARAAGARRPRRSPWG